MEAVDNALVNGELLKGTDRMSIMAVFRRSGGKPTSSESYFIC